jgi:uncharacterized protein (DUF488 family)
MMLKTVGHSNRPLSELIDLLKASSVSYVVDIRSTPHSTRFPHFNRLQLEKSLRNTGIDYLYLGDLLGGQPGSDEGEHGTKWTQGRLDPHLLSSLRRSQRWKQGVEVLASLVRDRASNGQIGCLLCSEADPARCHRSLVALELEAKLPDLRVSHLISQDRHPREEIGVQEPLM